MKRLIAVIALLLATTLSAQDGKFQSKVFQIQHRDPREIADAVKLLGSGAGNAGINVNKDLSTITVRDFPENIAAIQEAIQRLDRAAPPARDIVLKISTLIGSKSAMEAAPVPDDLLPVVKQLQSTLRYAKYGLLAATVLRTQATHVAEGSGVADPALFGSAVKAGNPIVYTYRLHGIRPASGERPAVDVESFAFSMRVPVSTGGGVTYQPVGFETPVSIRENEKVVIGTTTLGDKALIVVVSANLE